MNRWSFHWIWLILCLGLNIQVNAQWNLIAGYDLSSIQETKINFLIRDYNGDHINNSRQLKDVRVLNGFVVGARYGEEFGAGELSYTKRFTRRIGDDYRLDFIDDDGTLDTEIGDMDLYYDIQTIALTTEFGRIVRLGGSIDYNIYTYDINYLDVENIRDFKSNTDIWGSKVFLGVHLANTSSISFSVRAYYQWIWSYSDLEALEMQLYPGEECTYCREKPYTFGLTFLINNRFGR